MTSFTPSRKNDDGRPRGYVVSWRPHAKTKALLENVDEVLDRYENYLPLTLRQIFYALVGAEQLDKNELAYKRLSHTLNVARRNQRIPFWQIRDDGVSVDEEPAYDGLQAFHDETAWRQRNYRRDRQADRPRRIEFWCEAQGMMPQLATVAARYSVPVYSSGGFLSPSAVRYISERAVERNVPTVLLHVGDFDPSGESIFTAMTEDAAAFVEADRVLATARIIGERVALTQEQVDEYNLPSAPAKASDSRSAAWEGGTCQLEALPPDVLAQLVEDAIVSHLQTDTFLDVLETERDERAQLLGLPSGEDHQPEEDQ